VGLGQRGSFEFGPHNNGAMDELTGGKYVAGSLSVGRVTTGL
jgi:hypothetical protein